MPGDVLAVEQRGPIASRSLCRNRVVTNLVEQVLQIPGDLPVYGAERDWLHYDYIKGRVSDSGCWTR